MSGKNQNTGLQSRMHVIYLHGFASSPSSVKAIRFKEMLVEKGAKVEIPDLNFPTFKEMTISNQLDLVEKMIDRLPEEIDLVLIGSSMGGLLASLLSLRRKVSALVLLAPGFGIARRWKEFVSEEEYENWKKTGEHSFYHHAYDAFMPLGYQFARDMESIQSENIIVEPPCLVFHGEHDTTVSVEESKSFARLNKTVDLRVLNDDHQLLSSLDHMLRESEQFLRHHRLVPA